MPALKKGLSGLEPYEGKLSRTVLRGGSGGNITLLPGETVQSLVWFDKLWTEDCVQWCTDARGVRTNKECPDGFVRLVAVMPLFHYAVQVVIPL